MTIEVDRDICIGAGNCVLAAPDLFDQDDEGLVLLLTTEVSGDRQSAAETAAQRCPAGAILLD
jgi:ferredoxin